MNEKLNKLARHRSAILGQDELKITVAEAADFVANNTKDSVKGQNVKVKNKYELAQDDLLIQKAQLIKMIEELVKVESEIDIKTALILKKIKKSASDSLQQVEKLKRQWDGDYSNIFKNIEQLAYFMTVLDGFSKNQDAMSMLKNITRMEDR
jgi:Txe/YoeB family toxin of Txe-Axe toxin-antitoxin module